jgi:uncharacterized membrane protein YuzA (DUF378 family)
MDKMDTMKIVGQVASVLVIVGALNWLLIGSLNLNIVQKTVGDKKDETKQGVLERAVYILVGLSAVYLVYQKYMMKEQL